MSKPTVFFSHSSKDKIILGRLKEAFASKTGSTIDIFLSSDGQSIPLGKNWVYRVQEGLESAALMLVFITPNSVDSSWVYFESGYSYCKQIKVVPIGLGVDLTKIGPPLSLLQGFNITSADSLNNIIKITNDEFSYKHALSFTQEDYVLILGSGVSNLNHPFRETLGYIDAIKINFRKSQDQLTEKPIDLIEKFEHYLKERSIEHYKYPRKIISKGLEINAPDGVYPEPLSLIADPLSIRSTFPLVCDVLNIGRSNGLQNVDIEFKLTSECDILEETYKISSRLYDTDMKIVQDGHFQYQNYIFKTGYYYSRHSNSSTAYLDIRPTENRADLFEIGNLLNLLFENKVIYFREPNLFE